MTAAEARLATERLVPDRGIIATEQAQLIVREDGARRTALQYRISLLPAVTSADPCQIFHGASFPDCLAQIKAAAAVPASQMLKTST